LAVSANVYPIDKVKNKLTLHLKLFLSFFLILRIGEYFQTFLRVLYVFSDDFFPPAEFGKFHNTS
jgi:hypothetical protein